MSELELLFKYLDAMGTLQVRVLVESYESRRNVTAAGEGTTANLDERLVSLALFLRSRDVRLGFHVPLKKKRVVCQTLLYFCFVHQGFWCPKSCVSWPCHCCRGLDSLLERSI